MFKVQTQKKTSYFEPNHHYGVKRCLRHSVDHQGNAGLDGAGLNCGWERSGSGTVVHFTTKLFPTKRNRIMEYRIDICDKMTNYINHNNLQFPVQVQITLEIHLESVIMIKLTLLAVIISTGVWSCCNSRCRWQALKESQ